MFYDLKCCSGILKETRQVRSPGTLHILGPRDPKHLHEFGALAVCPLTEPAARQGDAAVLHAHGSVEGTQEGSKISGAFQIHHRMKWLEKKKAEFKSFNRQLCRTLQQEAVI